jgi:ATP-dependent helicase/nuclease subunit B
LSDEAQLVWSLWKSQLDSGDETTACFTRIMQLARNADASLIWINAVEPDAMESAFLQTYAEHQPVQMVLLDWRPGSVDGVYASAWSENHAEESLAPDLMQATNGIATPAGISLYPAISLEDEASHAAQTVIDWLREGKASIAIIAQDRMAARRIRALLERSQVFVSDETGWKLSTTRIASTIAALLDAVATRGATAAVLDLLKSPFLFAGMINKQDHVMTIEGALRRSNVSGGWEAAMIALTGNGAAQQALRKIADQARLFAGRKPLAGWADATHEALRALGMRAALAVDAAGAQVMNMLDGLARECSPSAHDFSFSEWRAFIALQLESTPFKPSDFDQRVVMLQLNGARLRSFDAVLMVGADANHLPSQENETLFFANAVRRELGLATREMRQRQQLRDFSGLLNSSRQAVLSWQSCKNGEPNSISAWVARLQLTLDRAGARPLPLHEAELGFRQLTSRPSKMPAPVAPHLLPGKLSASGYNSLVACPYQFFATRMLGLTTLDELSDMPEKRDYGDWLHRILTTYHETVRDQRIALHERAALMKEISEDVFHAETIRSAAALGFHARWQKIMPAYLAWANERESQGWQFLMGEQRFEKTISWPGGDMILHGRIDRIDCNGDGEWAVLDYKASNLQALRERLHEREDHQLAFYGMLCDVPVTSAHYVALDAVNDKTGDAQARDYEEWQRALHARLGATMHSVAQGAPLPASGIERICRFCEVRGLCRKGVW